MEKITQTLKDEALMNAAGKSSDYISGGGIHANKAQVSELSYPAVRKIIRLYDQADGWNKTGNEAGRAGEKPQPDGRTRAVIATVHLRETP